MTTTNNGIPLYAEEIIINQEFDQIQETLSQFKQPVPNDFVELEQLNWMCSTQGWKEPLCERYNCLIKGEWKQVDISHSLLNKLELAKNKNIPYPVHISPTVINQGSDRYLAYNVKEEKEIFLEKPFTIQSLDKDINKLLDKIKELKIEKGEKQGVIDNLQNLLGIDNINNLPTLLGGETLVSLLARPTLTQLNDLRREKDQELTAKNTQITNLTNEVSSWQTNYNNLNNQLVTARNELLNVKNELQREKKWLDNWLNFNTNSYYCHNEHLKTNDIGEKIIENLSKLLPSSDPWIKEVEGVEFGIKINFTKSLDSYKRFWETREIKGTNGNEAVGGNEPRKIIEAIYLTFRDLNI